MISDETRALVLEKAAELDYLPSIPARTLRHGRSDTIATQACRCWQEAGV